MGRPAVWPLALVVASMLGRRRLILALYQRNACDLGESLAEVEGASGTICAPRCSETTYDCPAQPEVLGRGGARATCMLQDGGAARCGLLCRNDDQCPPGSRCTLLSQLEASMCLFPVSFADWATQSSAVKMAVGWPSRAGAGTAQLAAQSSQVSEALRRLKARYAMDDGDADLVVLKEAVASILHFTAQLPGPAGPVRGPPPPLPAGVWHHNGWRGPAAALEGELHEVFQDLERLDAGGGHATHLLKFLVLCAALYLVCGFYLKYQQGFRGWGALPHAGFWCEYPRLVNDGVLYFKMLTGLAPSESRELHGGVAHGARGDLPKDDGIGAFDPL